jgi:hypothetical protein
MPSFLPPPLDLFYPAPILPLEDLDLDPPEDKVTDSRHNRRHFESCSQRKPVSLELAKVQVPAHSPRSPPYGDAGSVTALAIGPVYHVSAILITTGGIVTQILATQAYPGGNLE